MTVYESAEGITLSRAQALLEVLEHNSSVLSFLDDLGDVDTYDAQAVLAWLGY